jgi:hypothetical protein
MTFKDRFSEQADDYREARHSPLNLSILVMRPRDLRGDLDRVGVQPDG